MITAADIITAILAIFPYMSGDNRQCIINNRTQIEHVLIESQQRFPNMPIEILATIGFMETHLGCDRGENGNWGAPISPTQRHVAGTPMHAAVALWHGYQTCGTWQGATRRFRTGLCVPNPISTRYERTAMQVVNRIRSYVSIHSQDNNLRICRAVPVSCQTK